MKSSTTTGWTPIHSTPEDLLLHCCTVASIKDTAVYSMISLPRSPNTLDKLFTFRLTADQYPVYLSDYHIGILTGRGYLVTKQPHINK